MTSLENLSELSELGQPVKYLLPITIIGGVLFYWVQNNLCLSFENLPPTMLTFECYIMSLFQCSWIYLCLISYMPKNIRIRFDNEKSKSNKNEIHKIIFKNILLIMIYKCFPIGYMLFMFRMLGYFDNLSIGWQLIGLNLFMLFSILIDLLLAMLLSMYVYKSYE